MSWVTIIVMIISYYMSSKSGKSKGQSAAIAAGAGLASYYVYDQNALGIEALNGQKTGIGMPTLATSADGAASTTPGTGGTPSTIGLGGVVGTTGEVLKSWGPTGTAAVIGTTALATNSSLQKYLPWLLIGGAALLLMK